MARGRGPVLVAVVALLILAAGAPRASGATPVPRGQGSMHVRQAVDCSGTGNASSVHLPFGLLFTGFLPNTTGTVTASTQPGGVVVGQATVTVDALGNRCEQVTGPAPPGQYKIEYDFGSGAGKSKVVRLVEGPSPTEPETPGETESPTPDESPTVPETASEIPTTTVSPTSTLTVSAAPPSASPSPTSSVAGEELEFIPEPDAVGDAAARLPKTGADGVNVLAGVGSVLALLGLGLVVAARRRPASRHR